MAKGTERANIVEPKIEKEILSKKLILKRFLIIFFGSILFAFIITMIGTNGKPFSEGEGKIFFQIMLKAIAVLFIVLLITAIVVYKFSQKNPKAIKKIQNVQRNRNVFIFVIVYGIVLILSTLYNYFINDLNDSTPIKILLIRIGLGVFIVILGAYYLRKNKAKEISN
jgi:heme/copper-type cytochrome/quinol oxidase subunit 2